MREIDNCIILMVVNRALQHYLQSPSVYDNLGNSHAKNLEDIIQLAKHRHTLFALMNILQYQFQKLEGELACTHIIKYKIQII